MNGLHPLQVKAKELDDWLNEERQEFCLEHPLTAERYKSADISQTLEADRGFLRHLVFKLKYERDSAIEEYGKFMEQVQSEQPLRGDALLWEIERIVRTYWRFLCPERTALERKLSKFFAFSQNEIREAVEKARKEIEVRIEGIPNAPIGEQASFLRHLLSLLPEQTKEWT